MPNYYLIKIERRLVYAWRSCCDGAKPCFIGQTHRTMLHWPWVHHFQSRSRLLQLLKPRFRLLCHRRTTLKPRNAQISRDCRNRAPPRHDAAPPYCNFRRPRNDESVLANGPLGQICSATTSLICRTKRTARVSRQICELSFQRAQPIESDSTTNRACSIVIVVRESLEKLDLGIESFGFWNFD